MPHDVFLSYASADRAAADAVCAALEARGIVCWMAPRDVRAGEDWGEAILTAIGRAHAMVLVLSRHTAGSVHVRNEVVTAVSQGLALVPVRIEDCQPGGALRLHLAGSHWLNVFPPPIEQHADALAAGVRLALAADATIELPRAQAAALVAAARAASQVKGVTAPAGQAPAERAVAQLRAATSPPVAHPIQPAAHPGETPPGPAPAPRPSAPHRATPAGVPGQAPALPGGQAGNAGRGALVAILLLLVLAAAGAAAWVLQPWWGPLVGAAPATAPATAPAVAEAPPAETPSPPRSLVPPPALPGVAGPVLIVPPATRVTNAASETITRLHVVPAGDPPGGEDWLGAAQLTPGNAVLLRAPPGRGCLFDVRAVYVGGATEDRPGTDLCAASELRFEGGKTASAAPRR